MQLKIRLSSNDTFSHFPIECFLILINCEVLIKLTMTTSQSTIAAPPVRCWQPLLTPFTNNVAWTLSWMRLLTSQYSLSRGFSHLLFHSSSIIIGQFYPRTFMSAFWERRNWGTKRSESSQSDCDAPQCDRSLWGGVCCFMPLVTIIVVNAQPSSLLAWLRSESAGVT